MRKVKVIAILLICLMTAAGTAYAAPGSKGANSNPGQGQGQENNRNFVTQLIGANEVPPVQTAAHGVAIFHLSKDGLSMDYKLIVTDVISVTAGHIHTGTVGLNGPVVVPLYNPSACTTNGTEVRCAGTFTAANLVGPLAGHPLSDLVTLMREGRAYSNVHTTAHPGGEIRGQIDRGHGHAGGEGTLKGLHLHKHHGHH